MVRRSVAIALLLAIGLLPRVAAAGDFQTDALRAALARYRTLAGRETGERLPCGPSIRPGDAYASIGLLRDRLVLLGDADASGGAPLDRYEGAIVDAVRRFQGRHGLEPDGVVGKDTCAALNVPLAARVVQIERVLGRLSASGVERDGREVVVNIPMFQVTAGDGASFERAPAFTSRVIVGRAVLTETPELTATLTEIVFRPYWNIPTSILRKELLPPLLRERDIDRVAERLASDHMEIVDGQGDRSPVVAVSAETLAGLRSGALRLRQRPGPKNALGRIKFVFPNPYDVYMHATPEARLFARSRRDFSHGCIRLEDPVGFAEWLLRDRAGWDRTRILAAMDASESSRIAVDPPVRVRVVYLTALVDPASGEVHFARDIYRRD